MSFFFSRPWKNLGGFLYVVFETVWQNSGDCLCFVFKRVSKNLCCFWKSLKECLRPLKPFFKERKRIFGTSCVWFFKEFERILILMSHFLRTWQNVQAPCVLFLKEFGTILGAPNVFFFQEYGRILRASCIIFLRVWKSLWGYLCSVSERVWKNLIHSSCTFF